MYNKHDCGLWYIIQNQYATAIYWRDHTFQGTYLLLSCCHKIYKYNLATRCFNFITPNNLIISQLKCSYVYIR